MLGLNEGTGYLCRIESNYVHEEVITVFVAGKSLQYVESGLEALDFGARAPDSRTILMVVQRSSPENTTGVLHKTAMTIPVSEDVSDLWQDQVTVTVSLGGPDCAICNEIRRSRYPQPPEPTIKLSASDPASGIFMDSLGALVQQLSAVVWNEGERKFLKRTSLRPRSFRYRQINLRRRRIRFLKRVSNQTNK